MTNKKGFTLVELLVVIGIIGVLATISVASLGSAQKRARDTKRIAIAKSLATVIEGEDAGTPSTTFTGCDGTAEKLAISECIGPSTVGDVSFKGATDPKQNSDSVACKTGGSVGCKFSIRKNTGTGAPLTDDYAICFYLEAGGAGLQMGIQSIRTGANFTSDCPF